MSLLLLGAGSSGSSAPTPWTPANLGAALKVWRNAGPTWCRKVDGTPCAVGDTVVTWLDQSGNGRTATQVGSGNVQRLRQDASGKYYVEAVGSDTPWMSATLANVLQPFCHFAGVRNKNLSQGTTRIFDSASRALWGYGSGGFGAEYNWYAGSGLFSSTSGAANNTIYQRLAILFSGASSSFVVNNATTVISGVGANPGGNGTGTSAYLFADNVGSAPCTVDIFAELLVDATALTPTDLANIDIWLASCGPP